MARRGQYSIQSLSVQLTLTLFNRAWLTLLTPNTKLTHQLLKHQQARSTNAFSKMIKTNGASPPLLQFWRLVGSGQPQHQQMATYLNSSHTSPRRRLLRQRWYWTDSSSTAYLQVWIHSRSTFSNHSSLAKQARSAWVLVGNLKLLQVNYKLNSTSKNAQRPWFKISATGMTLS